MLRVYMVKFENQREPWRVRVGPGGCTVSEFLIDLERYMLHHGPIEWMVQLDGRG